MFTVKFVSFFSFFVGVCYGQFVARNSDNITKKSLISIGKDYTPTLDDCPLEYFQYGGQYLTSSAAFNINFHHKFSHFVVLTNTDDEDFCNGVLISENWVLTTENCKKASIAKVGFNREGELKNFTAYPVKSYKEKDSLALLHLETVDFKGSVSSACLLEDLPKTAETYFLNELTVHKIPESGAFKVYQDQLTANHHLVPFVSLEVENFNSYLPWIQDETSLNFKPTTCSTRYINTRKYEPFTARPNEQNPNTEVIIALNALIQRIWHRGYRTSIYDGDEFKCAGILISEEHLITAASCGVKEGYTVKFQDSEKKVSVIRVVNHPDFDPKLLQHNIALLKLDGVPEFSDSLYPACIPPEDIEVLGFPHTQTGLTQVNCQYSNCRDEPLADDYKAAFIISNITDEAECQTFYQNQPEPRTINYKYQFCSGNNQRLVPGSCLSDIGGPIGRQLYYHIRYFNFVFGLNSYGQDCGCSFPTLATRLSSYRGWISTEAGLGKLSTDKEDRTFESRAKSCLEQPLESLETQLYGCNGVILNNAFVTSASCELGVEAVFQKHGSLVTIQQDGAKPFPSECIWNSSEKVPFFSMIEINGTATYFFTIFPRNCEKLYGFTLDEGEFCVESQSELEDYKEIPVGKAVWYTMSNKESKTTRASLLGIVKSSKEKEDDRFVAVVSLITANFDAGFEEK